MTGLLARPAEAAALFVFAHGAGAGPRHPFMEAVAHGLAHRGVATFRYAFPYMEAARKLPDPPDVLTATVRGAVAEARRLAGALPVFAGGKSMGGRMTSLAQAASPLEGVRGIAFLGFPLHPAGKPSAHRAEHLAGLSLPLLFLQGTRDRLADPPRLRGTLDGLACRAVAGGGPAPALHLVEGADHGFHVLKRSGRTDAEVVEEVCSRLAAWMGDVAGT